MEFVDTMGQNKFCKEEPLSSFILNKGLDHSGARFDNKNNPVLIFALEAKAKSGKNFQ